MEVIWHSLSACIQVLLIYTTDTLSQFFLSQQSRILTASLWLEQTANNNSPDALLMNLFITGAEKHKESCKSCHVNLRVLCSMRIHIMWVQPQQGQLWSPFYLLHKILNEKKMQHIKTCHAQQNSLVWYRLHRSVILNRILAGLSGEETRCLKVWLCLAMNLKHENSYFISEYWVPIAA